jgi:mRNA-degrading endonuclease RelE of RelBE toxin-antitoxin system
MNYHVDWTPTARGQLAELWVRHVAHRAQITAAAHQIDQLLAADPYQNGSPLSEGLYARHEAPLRVIYEISDAQREVTVDGVNWAP